MKRRNLLHAFASIQLVGLLAVVGIMLGCESGTTSTNLVITPASSIIDSNRAPVLLTVAAADGVAAPLKPLKWSVEDPTLGDITPSDEGLTAVYTPNDRNGANIIIVRDQTGGEGLASVNQQDSGI